MIDHRVRKALEIMALEKNVSSMQLKIQYHKLAKRVHPDVAKANIAPGLIKTSSEVKCSIYEAIKTSIQRLGPI